MIVAAIPAEAWTALTLGEQRLLLVLDDYARGRFGADELRRRLAGARLDRSLGGSYVRCDACVAAIARGEQP